jgi:adenine phosphoribosyltransferase
VRWLASGALAWQQTGMADFARIRSAVRDVPDFPKAGIVFKDITPILSDGALFREVIDGLVGQLAGTGVHKVAGVDARGFIFAGAVADRLGIGFVPIRKKGKLPWRARSAAYALEYGEAIIELHEDAVLPGEKVTLIDDVLATGGTAAAAVELLRGSGGDVVAAQFVIELGFLGGRSKLVGTPVKSLLAY